MHPHTFADDFWLDDCFLQKQNRCTNHQSQHRRSRALHEHLVAVHQRKQQHWNGRRDHAKVRNDAEQPRRKSDENGVRQSDDRKPNRQTNAHAKRHQNLAAKKYDETIVEGRQHEYRLFLETRFLERKIIAPFHFNGTRFQ